MKKVERMACLVNPGIEKLPHRGSLIGVGRCTLDQRIEPLVFTKDCKPLPLGRLSRATKSRGRIKHDAAHCRLFITTRETAPHFPLGPWTSNLTEIGLHGTV